MYKPLKNAGETANFSIILPGPCNAKCGFCFWQRSDAESPMFLQYLRWYLDTLGPRITQISVTGGEPTLSPLFDGVMDILRGRLAKVVLTTNGAALSEKLSVMSGMVQHLNISRHEVDDADNYEVFNTRNIPSSDELTDICDNANRLNIDVTINKVIPHDYNNVGQLNEMVGFVKRIGASALALRKDYSHNSLAETPLEMGMGRKAVKRSCPVCVTNSYLYRGVPVHFKMSLEEPSAVLPYIYEFVYHPDAKLTEDWAGKKEIEFGIEVTKIQPAATNLSAFGRQINRAYVGGCAQTSSGCGQRSGC